MTVVSRFIWILTTLLLSFLQETFDAEELFHTPVVEKFPDVAEKYYEKVSHPIDLRTIREERVPYYRVISELQDDLILVFQNCCTFNRVNSQYWKYSV